MSFNIDMEDDRLLWVNYGARLLEVCRTSINYIINLNNLHKNTGHFKVLLYN